MNNKQGFTIIEMTVVVLIATIVLIIIGSMFVAQWQLYRSQSAISEIQNQNRIAQNIISKTIQISTGIVASSTINSESYYSDIDTIILQVPSVDSSQNIITGSYDYIVFEQDSTDPTKLISNTEASLLSARTSEKKTIAQFVSSLNFEYNESIITNSTVVGILITTQKIVEGLPSSNTRQSQSFKAVELKNK